MSVHRRLLVVRKLRGSVCQRRTAANEAPCGHCSFFVVVKFLSFAPKKLQAGSLVKHFELQRRREKSDRQTGSTTAAAIVAVAARLACGEDSRMQLRNPSRCCMPTLSCDGEKMIGFAMAW